MADFSSPRAAVLPLHISTLSRYGCGFDAMPLKAAALPAAVTWVTNIVSYMPLAIPFPYPVARVFWINGSTITTTNVDMGIYTLAGKKIYSTGSTAMVGASSVQYVAVATPFVLDPGQYYLAWTCSGTTSRGFALAPTTAVSRMMGMVQETTAIPLPTTMTPVTWAQAFGPSVCGITRTASGF